MNDKKENQEIAALVSGKDRKALLKEQYRKQEKEINEKLFGLGKKLQAARTHAFMEATPRLVKALGFPLLANISLKAVTDDESLKEHFAQKKSWASLFDEFKAAVDAVIEWLEANPEARESIKALVEARVGAVTAVPPAAAAQPEGAAAAGGFQGGADAAS